MKQCCRCGDIKSVEDFHKRSVNSDGRQGYCKECARKHYKAWQDQDPDRKNRHKEWKLKRKSENRQKLKLFLESKKCIDCGINDWRVLEFDHVRGTKFAGIADMIARGSSWEMILEEIDKCEVRCANCHRIVTAERGDWWRK